MQASEGGVALRYALDGVPNEDGRWCLVGAIAGACGYESEEGVRDNPKEREGKDESSDGGADRPEMP